MVRDRRRRRRSRGELCGELFRWKVDADNPMQNGIATAEEGASATASASRRWKPPDT